MLEGDPGSCRILHMLICEKHLEFVIARLLLNSSLTCSSRCLVLWLLFNKKVLRNPMIRLVCQGCRDSVKPRIIADFWLSHNYWR